MANFNTFIAQLLKHEGGFVNHPNDPGGATNKGITLATWRSYGRDIDGDGDIDVNDLRLLTNADATRVYKQMYWDVIAGDQLVSQSLAEILFDHGVNAGPWRAISMVQEILNRDFGRSLVVDGKIGPVTVNAINNVNQNKLYNKFYDYREAYYLWRANYPEKVSPALQNFFTSVLRLHPSNSARAFIAGWLNRLASFGKKKTTTATGGVVIVIAIVAAYYHREKIKQLFK